MLTSLEKEKDDHGNFNTASQPVKESAMQCNKNYIYYRILQKRNYRFFELYSSL